MNNLSIVVSYHDLSMVKPYMIDKVFGSITDSLYLLNNNYFSSNELKELKKKYRKYDGVRFDEFNSQSFYADVLSKVDKNEYVYNTHYRRCFDLKDKIELKPNVIYCSISPHHVNTLQHTKHFLLRKNHKVSIQQDLDVLYNILSDVLGVSVNVVDELMVKHGFIYKEMYIMHKSLQKELVDKGIKFVKMCCGRFDEGLLQRDRIIGWMLEMFVSIFILMKRKEGYIIKPKKILTF